MNEKQFRLTGKLEGLSLLLLFFLAMPVKYGMGEPILVRVIGPIHGFLFLAYCYGAIELSKEKNWPKKTLLWCWILSCVPFGTFYFEKKYIS